MAIFWEIFAARLKDARQRAGRTQDDARRAIGVTQSYISGLEKGHSRPAPIEKIYELLRYYEASADYVFGVSDQWTATEREKLGDMEIDLLRIFEKASANTRAEILKVLQVMVDADMERQQAIRESRFFLDVVEGAGPEAMDVLVDVLRTTRDLDLRRERLHEWLDANFPSGDLSSEP